MNDKHVELITEKVFAKSGLGKWFNQESAGGGPGWDRYNTKGERIGKCGDADEGESYAACLSKQKAKKLGKEGVASFVRRKRAAQKKAGRGEKGDVRGKGKKPVFVDTGVKDVKECTEVLIIENSNNIVPLSFPFIEARELLPFDTIITESGKLLNVDEVEQKEDGNYSVKFSNECGCEVEESFSPDTVMGFVDVTEGHEYNEFGDMLEIHEEDGKKVKLNKIMRGDVKKYKVYVKNDKGNVVKVNFGDPNMEIKRDDPNRRRNFRARHNCDNPGPRWKARYWACKTWSTQSVSSMLKESDVEEIDPIGFLDEESEKQKKKKEQIPTTIFGEKTPQKLDKKPSNVLKEENKPKDSKKWSSCIAQAKKKFDVYPSAYANAWASKCYKSKGGKWKKLSEDMSSSILKTINDKNYDPNLFGALEYRNNKN